MYEQKLTTLSFLDEHLWRETKNLLQYKSLSAPLINPDN